jgi:hypothetical protein
MPLGLPLAIGTTMVLLWGCYLPAMYSGDGKMSQPMQGVFSYQVDLGRVNLARTGVLRRTLSGMPREGFTVGFEVARKGRAPSDSDTEPPLRAKIRLRLANERGEIVIHEEGPLNEWVWTARRGGPYDSAFIYRRGSVREIPVGNDGSVRVVQEPTRPDGGWGTSFEPRHGGTYELTVEILAADSNATNFEVSVIAYGGARPSL